jgi:hypothetical protein
VALALHPFLCLPSLLREEELSVAEEHILCKVSPLQETVAQAAATLRYPPRAMLEMSPGSLSPGLRHIIVGLAPKGEKKVMQA